MRAKRARRAANQNFGDTLDTLVPFTARHCELPTSYYGPAVHNITDNGN